MMSEFHMRREDGGALQENAESFGKLIQNASDIIAVLEEDGTVRYSSPAVERVLGYEPREIVGANALDFLHPEDVEYLSTAAGDGHGEEGVSSLVEFRCRHKDGSWRHLEAIGNNLLDDPSVDGVVINARDVTDRHQAKDALRRSVEALLALHEAGQLFGSTLELEEVGSRLLNLMRRVPSLNAAVINLLDEPLEPRVWHTAEAGSPWYLAHHTPEAEAARGALLRTGSNQLFRFENPDPRDRRRVAGLHMVLRGRKQIMGVLEVYGPRTLLDRDTVEILGSLANQAAGALANARLYQRVADREWRLKQFVGQLILTQEKERRRVAYEVHDGLAQVAAAAHQHLQAFARRYPLDSEMARRDQSRILELVRQTVVESRKVIADLRPTTLDDFGLSVAVASEVESLRQQGYRVDLTEDLGKERLPDTLEAALFRITQEALRNVQRHAHTRWVLVRLRRRRDAVLLKVQDWGRGFELNGSRAESGPGERVGIAGMRERVNMLDGKLKIRSEPGAGTSVTVVVPLPTVAGLVVPTGNERERLSTTIPTSGEF